MFEYFRGNYVWNLATNLTLGSGGLIGEIDTVARSIVDAGLRNDDAAQEEWVQAFIRLAGHVHQQGRRDEQAGHLHSAGRKLGSKLTVLPAARMVCMAVHTAANVRAFKAANTPLTCKCLA
mgnify:CR=1 FL=1